MEHVDAVAFAAAQVDFLKYDNCNTTAASFARMRDALNSTGRPIVLSLHSSWTDHHSTDSGRDPDPTTSAQLANMWRTTPDIPPQWTHIMNRAHQNN